MAETQFYTGFGDFEIKLLHHHPKSPLRAWDAADEYALAHLLEASMFSADSAESSPRILVVNDSEGALAVALNAHRPVFWGDRYTSGLALQKNLQRNGVDGDCVLQIPGHESPPGRFDVVVIKLPKTLSLLHAQLAGLRGHLAEDAVVVGAGMVKHMTSAMQDAFERYIGPARTTLARKKARLILSEVDASRSATVAPPPFEEYTIPGTQLTLVNYANVFSRQRLDIGTRFFLEQFPDLSAAQTVVDLGCGNGALGIYAGARHPHLMLTFLDDSYLALHSAEDSFQRNGLTNPAEFLPSDALSAVSDRERSFDAILCNPPFHEGNKVHTEIALRMFRQAAQCLEAEGELHIVANRHLGYDGQLRKWFREVHKVAQNQKFVILRAERPT